MNGACLYVLQAPIRYDREGVGGPPLHSPTLPDIATRADLRKR